MTTRQMSNVAALVSRVTAAFLGAWVLTWAFVALATALGHALGMAFGEASALAQMLGLLLMLVACCWAVVARRLALVWSTFVVGSAALSGAAWLLANRLAS